MNQNNENGELALDILQGVQFDPLCLDRKKATVQQEDCIEFLKKLPSESVDVIVTDPAYSGMNQKLKFGNGRIVGRYQKEGNGKWFEEFHDTYENYKSFLNECKRVLKPNSHIYIMFDSYSLLTLGHLLRDFFDVKNIIVWDKVNLGMGHYFRRRHEVILFASKGKRKINSRAIPDIWQFKRIVNPEYPTQKPVEVFEAMLAASAYLGAVICDPFVGSGSSAIAALKKGCYFIGADISAKACKLSRERIDSFLRTGKDPLQPDSAAITQKLGFWM